MADPQLLVVEPDPASRGLILTGLRRQGLRAIGVQSGYEALGRLDDVTPTLVVSEVSLPDLHGTDLVRRFRSRRPTAEVPFYFLTASDEVDADTARSHGAQDLLRKPAFVADLATLARLHAGRPAQSALLGGQLEAMGLAHLLRALASGVRSGRVVILEGEGEVRFHRGRIVDAIFRERSGEPALLRLLTLTRGSFEIAFDLSPDDAEATGSLDLDVTRLLVRGFPHVRRWEQIVSSLYPLETPLVVDYAALARRLHEIPDPVNAILRLFDGRRTIEAVIDGSGLPDLVALEVVGKLDSMGLLRPVDAPSPKPPRPWPGAGTGPVTDTPAADGLLQSLFDDVEAPTEGAAVAADVPQTNDWWEDYVKGAEPWSDILPPLGDATDPWAGHRECEAILEALGAGSLGEALDHLPLGGIEAPDLAGQDTPVQRRRPEAFAGDAGGASTSSGGAVFDEAEASFFERAERDMVAWEEAEAPADVARWPLFGRALVLGSVAVVLLVTALFLSGRAGEGSGDAMHLAEPSPAGVATGGDAMRAEAEAVSTEDVVRILALEDVAIGGAEAAAAPEPIAEPRPAATEARAAAEGASHGPTPDAADVAALLAGGQAAYERGALNEARRAFRTATEADPENVAARLGLGLAALDAGRTGEAVAALREARRLDPTSDRAAVLLGTALQLRGDEAGARAAYRAYLGLAPDGAHADEVRRILAAW